MPDPRIPAPNSSEAGEMRHLAEVLAAYSQGWFPMAEPPPLGPSSAEPRVEWVQPSHRAIIPLDNRFHVPKSLAQRVRSGRFEISSDQAFEAVIRSCASAPRPAVDGHAEGTWLAPSIIDTFLLLHKHGHAHSIEAWLPSGTPSPREGAGGGPRNAHQPAVGPTHNTVGARLLQHLDISTPPKVLVAGLYGLVLGKVFCGESMFHRPDLGGTDASKVCLVHLVGHLRARGFELLDAQLANHHTAQFGMYEMPREEYLERLAQLSMSRTDWRPFESTAPI